MRCFPCSNLGRRDEPKTIRSVSTSLLTSSTDHDARRQPSDNSSNNVSETSTESSVRISFTRLSQKPSNLRVFAFAELKTATKNFSRSLMIGEGGFGGVYKGVIWDHKDSDKKIDVAVKQLSRRGLQGHKEWVTEVNVLGIVEHPNLVKLIGYCAEDDERGIQRLLVYEYLPNGSVHDHLSGRFQTPLPWTTRMKIAKDAALGLAYLHEGMDFQIIFRDMKPSNILLDDNWNAKLSDFGLARLGPSDGLSHVSTAVVGTIGYAAPEYIQTGRLTSKSDVWSYGVFLYELITGRRPLDKNRPKGEQNLLEWIRPHLADIKKFEQILDPRLSGDYFVKSAQKLAATANRCLMRHPKHRPRMSEVLDIVSKIMEESAYVKPEAPMSLSKDAPEEDSCREGSKGRFMGHIIGENRSLVWRTWRDRFVRETQVR